MKMKKRILIIVIAVVVVAIGAFLYFRFQSAKAKTASAYQTVTIEKGVLTGTVGATGTVHPNQSAWLNWMSNGTVGKVNNVVGDAVNAGDVLSSLSTASLPQSIIMAEADLVTAQKALDDLKQSGLAAANAQQTLVTAQKDYDEALRERTAMNSEIVTKTVKMTPFGPRMKKEKRWATPREISEADAKLAVAKAKMDDAQREWDRLKDGPDPKDIIAAEARVAAAQATIDLQQITAPFSGTLTDVPVKVGDVVNAGNQAFRLDDLSKLQVDVQVSEVDINRVKVGQDVTLSFDAILSKEYHGKVIEVAKVGTSDQGVVNFTVTVEITDADELVLPQMTAAVNIVVVQLSDVTLIPNRAVRLVDGKRVVYLMVNGTPTATPIEVGASSDNYSELVSGDIKVGDTIVANPPSTMLTNPRQGMQMRIRN